MDFRKSIIFFLSVSTFFSFISCTISNSHVRYAFDSDLYESVLDPELCQKQLQYLRTDTLLNLQFLDAGLRIPRGIFNGNSLDLGNFPQCLAINKDLEDMTIKGKYCRINLPISFLEMQNDLKSYTTFDTTELHNNEEYLLEQTKKERLLTLAWEAVASYTNGRSEIGDSSLRLRLAVCLPQPCTTKEAINSFLLNTSAIGLEYEEISCRLPNDKPWVAADYVAWIIAGLFGLITILSTIYDVRHTLILKKDPKAASELMSAFSIYTNSCKLIKITTYPGSLECIDGIRALSIMWVIIGHTFVIPSTNYPANILEMFNWYTSINAIWIKTATLAVDTFFLLSGLLVVYTTTKKFSSRQLAKNLHVFYLHRLLRIFPVLAAVILFKASFAHHLGDGPVWSLAATDVQTCRSSWWSTLLHLQNFLSPVDMCIPESWYLAIDMQLHILSPLVLLWVLSGAKRSAWLALILGFLISFIGAVIYIFTNDFSPDGLNNFQYYYINTLTRSPPFFIGMIFGYLLHLWRDNKCGMSKILGQLTTVFSLAVLVLILYCDHLHADGDINLTLHYFFMAFNRSFWVLAVGWIIFACVNGYAGPINWFLSLSVWKIPSRISYSMYLIHMTLMYSYFGTLLQPIYFTVPSFLFYFCGFLYITLFIGFFMTALIDASFATLFRLLLISGRKKPSKAVLPTQHTANDELFSKQINNNNLYSRQTKVEHAKL